MTLHGLPASLCDDLRADRPFSTYESMAAGFRVHTQLTRPRDGRYDTAYVVIR